MRSADTVIEELKRSGELWESAPGLMGLRGRMAMLHGLLEARISGLTRLDGCEEWRIPAGLAFSTLARAEYFASFPQWLTAASHLPDEDALLASVADSDDPAAAASASFLNPAAALPPAVCYHVYEAIAGTEIDHNLIVTGQGTCWRHEGDRTRPLERGWAFTMREIIFIGSHDDVEGFRQRMISAVLGLAEELELDPALEVATDPFFAPTARGKAILQKLKALKHELLLPVEPGRALAAASFNHHETFFGEAFDIRLPDGSPAATGCVAFGIERWLLAFLVAHGTNPDGWPALRSELQPQEA
jgi:seryl-tRNA synthetase